MFYGNDWAIVTIGYDIEMAVLKLAHISAYIISFPPARKSFYYCDAQTQYAR
jgi:NADPH-dependent 7-cyano-7-deazaguanine reductase QueF